MTATHRRIAAATCGLLLGSLGACVPDQAKAPGPKGTAPPAVPKGTAPDPAWDLPALARPEAARAARVIHLVYTSNVDGELEPCG